MTGKQFNSAVRAPGEARTGDNLSLRTVKISFSLHHSKKADSHSEDKASYTNVNVRTARLRIQTMGLWCISRFQILGHVFTWR
jgi:hypothetical protein